MASGLIISCKMEREIRWAVTDYVFLGSKNHCRWWLHSQNSKMLAPWKKTMTNLDNILKSRDITLLAKVCIVKSMVFPVVMYRCENWTIKKAECLRVDAFELCCWRRFESPLDSMEIKLANPQRNQHWIFIGRTDTEVGAPILWPTDGKYSHWKRSWHWERLKAGGEGDDRG